MTNLDKLIELNRDKVIDAIQRVYCINPETFELVNFPLNFPSSNGLMDMNCDDCIWHKMAMEQDGKNGIEFRCDDYANEWLNKEIKE